PPRAGDAVPQVGPPERRRRRRNGAAYPHAMRGNTKDTKDTKETKDTNSLVLFVEQMAPDVGDQRERDGDGQHRHQCDSAQQRDVHLRQNYRESRLSVAKGISTEGQENSLCPLYPLCPLCYPRMTRVDRTAASRSHARRHADGSRGSCATAG